MAAHSSLAWASFLRGFLEKSSVKTDQKVVRRDILYPNIAAMSRKCCLYLSSKKKVQEFESFYPDCANDDIIYRSLNLHQAGSSCTQADCDAENAPIKISTYLSKISESVRENQRKNQSDAYGKAAVLLILLPIKIWYIYRRCKACRKTTRADVV